MSKNDKYWLTKENSSKRCEKDDYLKEKKEKRKREEKEDEIQRVKNANTKAKSITDVTLNP
jgi:hypothetical protein